MSNFSNWVDYHKLSSETKILSLTGETISEDLIRYSEDLSRFIILVDDISTFIILDGSNKFYAQRDDKSKIWVLFSEFDYNLKENIKRKLGYPLVRVELTEQQLKDSIDEAINEISPWVVQPESITVNVAESIDLTDYAVSYIINVIPADLDTSTEQVNDIFSTQYQINSYRDAVYTQLEVGLINRINAQVGSRIHWTWFKKDNTLMIDVGTTNAKRITIEYSPRVNSTSDLVDEIYLNFINKFALAFARETLASIRGKFTVDGSPVSLDADNQDSKSSSELERLRQELKDTVSTHFMVD